MLSARTDLPAIAVPEPLSKDSVVVLFDKIRLDLGLPLSPERQQRLEQLEKAGYFDQSYDLSKRHIDSICIMDNLVD